MRFIVVTILVMASLALNAQSILTGLVADSATFEPLPFVTVSLKNKNKGTITDGEGSFKIVADVSDTLVFQYLGYNTLEFPARGWDANLILLSERPTVLRTIIIRDSASHSYEDLFRDQNAEWERGNKKLPFYYSRTKKQNIRVNRLENENLRVRTYVDVVIKNEDNKKRLMSQYALSETEYYDALAAFNATNYRVMYYLTAGELLTLLNNHFASRFRDRN
jgi:hypothetical protein